MMNDMSRPVTATEFDATGAASANGWFQMLAALKNRRAGVVVVPVVVAVVLPVVVEVACRVVEAVAIVVVAGRAAAGWVGAAVVGLVLGAKWIGVTGAGRGLSGARSGTGRYVDLRGAEAFSANFRAAGRAGCRGARQPEPGRQS